MSIQQRNVCPDCGSDEAPAVEIAGQASLPPCGGESEWGVDRRSFLHSLAGTTAVVAAGLPLWAVPRAGAAPSPSSKAETAVKALYETLTDAQKKVICFDWDYQSKERGLLRTHISNFWAVTKPFLASNYYTKDQQALAYDIFKGIFNPDWHEKFLRQLKDDHGGKPWGGGLSCAFFGQPGTGKFQFVMTGRHMTIRADGDSSANMALGGPIFHGHAATGFNEKKGHPGNIFWHQALAANKLYQVLDGKQQEKALVDRRPAETAVGFRGPDGKYPGIQLSELQRDQKEGVKDVLLKLLEPYRKEDQDKVAECLKKLGGLDACSLAFYKDGDIGDDGEWDNWRLEGPAFVWYFRGEPHVHIWINVASDPSLPLNSKNF